MISPILTQFIIILPEIMLTLLALLTQLSAVLFIKKTRIITNITILLSIVLFIACVQGEAVSFSNSFATNSFTGVCKSCVLLFSVMTMIIYNDYCKITNEKFKTEFITLMLLSTVGIFITISARNFLLLFVAMELQALAAYVLAGFSLHNIKSSEGALKYFILGSLISCLTLFGMSFIYGFGGSLDYNNILCKLNQSAQPNIGLIIGLVLFLSGIFFKLSSAPLHIWTPDVYEGSPIPSVSYFAAATKFGNVVVLLNIMMMVVGDYKQISVDLIKITAILSMLVGAGGAIRQTSLKRLMGYSTILNIGYVLMGIALHSEQGNNAALVYMLIYAASVTGFFACLIALLGQKADTANFDDIKGLANSRKALAAEITIIMFSMIGIPPLVGFFGKYFIFYQAIVEEQFTIAFVAIGSSIIAAYYYLKIVRSMYFFEANKSLHPESIPTYQGLRFVSCLVIGFLLIFSFFMS
ncbi:NADH-quinone oxidoreductase subunit NuoN [Candidatus Tisiphia endosymbiont of Sialis lutaria]|uniref:NADH-quinone oxidoreductase subunit NuoN n=1 Tax=Candidatus Tisiphia endosymbiont of Sialis lutaria TaxID=2029164 RepID=UPI00312CB560